MKKWIRAAAMAGLLLCLSACETKKEVEEEPLTAVSMEIEETVEVPKVEETWYDFPELDLAMKLPKEVVSTPAGELEKDQIFLGESDSFTIELRRWDQVSDPDVESLAALVGEALSVDTEMVTINGAALVKVNWPHGDVNYYILSADGDAYSLTITPYVMKDPDVYEKVRSIEGSLCRSEGAPNGEAIQVKLPEWEQPDYLILVDKKNPLPEGYEENLDIVSTVNSVGDVILVERTAYKAYLGLKKEVDANDGITLELDSAYRSVQYQQDILERFTKEYGAAYAARTVAKPGYSEHHTGLALDLYFLIGDELVYKNEDLVKYPEIWKKIHARLNDHGFILRYPGGEGNKVDYDYEPWHIRYVGLEAAQDLAQHPEETFEEWLAATKN